MSPVFLQAALSLTTSRRCEASQGEPQRLAFLAFPSFLPFDLIDSLHSQFRKYETINERLKTENVHGIAVRQDVSLFLIYVLWLQIHLVLYSRSLPKYFMFAS